MPCDTRLLTFNEMLRLGRNNCQQATSVRRNAGDSLKEQRLAGVQGAQERLDRAIFDEVKKIAEEREGTLITSEIGKLSSQSR